MTADWHSLYLHCNHADNGVLERVADSLRQSLTTLGYEEYDPFGPIPGRAYPHTVRLFVAPPLDGWLRVVTADGLSLEAERTLVAVLSTFGAGLSLRLKGGDCHLLAAHHGAEADPVVVWSPHLRAGKTADDLRRVFNGEALPSSTAASSAPAAGEVPAEALPEDVRQMADKLKPGQINRLFNQLLGTLGAELDDAGKQDALALLAGPDWGSVGGRQIHALAECLGLPDPYWHAPDFVRLRDAYQLHNRRRHRPDARLYPGDAEALAAIPDALEYRPVYGGKDA
jgi:hypothetical protein